MRLSRHCRNVLGGTGAISGHGDALIVTSQYPAPSPSAGREQSGATASEPQGMLIWDAAVPFPYFTSCTFTPQQPDIQGSPLPQPFPPIPSLKQHFCPTVRLGAEQCPCPHTQVWAGKRREDAKVCISQGSTSRLKEPMSTSIALPRLAAPCHEHSFNFHECSDTNQTQPQHLPALQPLSPRRDAVSRAGSQDSIGSIHGG